MRTRHATTTAVSAVLLLTATACGDPEPDTSDQMAAAMCQEFVKKRLKSPGSADFPSNTDTTTVSDSKPWKYKVNAYVDSQNGFGAKVRNDYVCTISTKGDGNWTLNDLDMTTN
jgi:hypothetical protein